MLAKTFKTYEELGLTKSVHKALHKVLENLETGVLKKIPYDGAPYYSDEPNGFNMNVHFFKHHCGTVGCIAGWAAHYAKTEWGYLISDHPKLNPLFYPRLPDTWSLADITTEQAAFALRKYLETGVISWSHLE